MQVLERTDIARVTNLNAITPRCGTVLYAMSRDQRSEDNWALIHAQDIAFRYESELEVVFCLDESYPRATSRHFDFMLGAFAELRSRLATKNIPFRVLTGAPPEALPKYAAERACGAIITDFDPLLIKKEWQRRTAAVVNCAFIVVDAHNVVPCTFASLKQEYAARTLRPKIQRNLMRFLVEIPKIITHPFNPIIEPDNTVINPLSGETAARRRLGEFVSYGFEHYHLSKNNPALAGTSGLSPFIHFGQIAAQRVALAVIGAGCTNDATDAFLEELIVRKELADNYCYNNEKYELFEGFPEWARKTLDKHRRDEREFVYSCGQFEQADTHDTIWNYAQRVLEATGTMHGYLRMYWAKKILEWSISPEEAMATAVYLNDRYATDGRDPNGYAGIAWSIGGVHDRPWFERPVFGMVRYMGRKGVKMLPGTL